MKKSYYVTTPIYYVTDAPHIGHLYTTVAADILAHYHRLIGEDVYFLTGTDEHGQKCEKKAKETGETPQALADRVVERYKTAWHHYGIRYSDFIRTTEERHKKVVQHYISELMRTGDIYLAEYEGLYCVPCETYWTETQAEGGKCADCGRPVEKLKEESYFFKMSAYQDRLLDHIERHPQFIYPESRRNEVLGFIKQGLKDISVSRTTIQWGIPMPKLESGPQPSKEHKVYVWFDALTNYLSALGPLEQDPKVAQFWPNAIHIVGKDILRFHAVYWPTFLMALGLPLPKQIVAHGWLTDSNRKISKSMGNAIDPLALAQEVGIDGMRYFLFREFVFGLDGEYTKEVMIQRINSDLANDYGNCISRTCSMILKYCGEGAVDITPLISENCEPREAVGEAIPAYHNEMQSYGFQRALEAAWKIIGAVNRYIDASAPWTLAKSDKPEDQAKLKKVLFQCHEALRITSLFLIPFIPASARKALKTLGASESFSGDAPLLQKSGWGQGPKKIQVEKPTPLFPRLEVKP